MPDNVRNTDQKVDAQAGSGPGNPEGEVAISAVERLDPLVAQLGRYGVSKTDYGYQCDGLDTLGCPVAFGFGGEGQLVVVESADWLPKVRALGDDSEAAAANRATLRKEMALQLADTGIAAGETRKQVFADQPAAHAWADAWDQQGTVFNELEKLGWERKLYGEAGIKKLAEMPPETRGQVLAGLRTEAQCLLTMSGDEGARHAMSWLATAVALLRTANVGQVVGRAVDMRRAAAGVEAGYRARGGGD